MDKEFVSYEQALALKELGFNEPCLAFYNLRGMGLNEKFNLKPRSSQYVDVKDLIALAPLYSQAFRWFRDKFGFIGVPTISNYSDDRYVFDIFQKENEEIYFEGSDLSDRNNGNKEYNTYEEAELACLKKLIEIVKNK